MAGNLHSECGETGAAHALVMFAKALQEAKPGDRILLAGFGQGCDALYFRVTDAIEKLPERLGVVGSLERKLTSDNYAKFLVFREQLKPEMGIRARGPQAHGPDHPLAQTRPGAGSGGRQVHQVRHAPVSPPAHLRQPGLPGH